MVSGQQLKLIYILKGWIASSFNFYSEGLHPDLLDEICRAVDLYPEFKREVYELLKPIKLNSKEEKETRAAYLAYLEQKNKWNPKEKEELIQPSPKDRVLEALDNFEKGDIEAWWQKIIFFMRFLPNGFANASEYEINLTRFPVWKEIDSETQNRLIQAAKTYLREGNPQTEKWIEDGELYYPAIAGYRAINLLNQFEPEFIESLDTVVWERWTATIYFIWATSENDVLEEHKQIIEKAYKAVPMMITQLLAKDIDRENRKEHSHLRLFKLDLCWDENLRGVLKEGLAKADLVNNLFNEMISKLFELNDKDAEKFACDSIIDSIPSEEKIQQRMISSISFLIEYGKTNCWQKIWSIINQDEKYGRFLIEAVVPGVLHNSREAFNLSEKQASDLFLWLSKNYPQSEDPIHHGTYTPSARDGIVRWRNSFLDYLIEKGTPDSVLEFKRIKNELPHLEYLKSLLIKATEKMREKTWQPLPPRELLGLFYLEKINNKVERLNEELRLFEKRKGNSDKEAERNARFRAMERWFFITLTTLAWVGIVLYKGWQDMEQWTWIVSIIIGLIITGFACWYLDDNYLPLSPSKILEQEKAKIYEKNKVKLKEGESISVDLEKAKRELRFLDKES